MPVHSCVGFEADFPTEARHDRPCGRELAEYLYRRLARAGVRTGPPEVESNYAWALATHDAGAEIKIMVGLAGDAGSRGGARWVVATDYHVPFKWRAFDAAQLHAAFGTSLDRLDRAIDAILASDDRFRGVERFEGDGPCPPDGVERT